MLFRSISVYTVKPVTKKTMTITILAKARNVPPVTRQIVPTFHRTNCRVTPVLDVTAISSENNVWAIITSIPPPMERKRISPKISRTCVTPNASVSTVKDYSELARSKRNTCAKPPSVPLAKSITISTVINVTYRTRPN